MNSIVDDLFTYRNDRRCVERCEEQADKREKYAVFKYMSRFKNSDDVGTRLRSSTQRRQNQA